MKTLAIAILLLAAVTPGAALSNPEIGNDGPIHFIINADNADQEHKPYVSDCRGGVNPNGDGTAWAEMTCYSTSSRLLWHKLYPGNLSLKFSTATNVPNIPCEMFDSSNNAGNDNGHNVTQYDSTEWAAEYDATEIDDNNDGVVDRYITKLHILCEDGPAR